MPGARSLAGGTNERLRSRFARVPVRTAPISGAAARGEETLLIEWPVGQPEPTKYWLATVDKNISFRALVDLAKMRWRVERDYLELKQEIGLGHYGGTRLAGFPPSRYAVHRRLRIPDPRTGSQFPPQDLIPPGGSKHLPFPMVTDPAAPPNRPQLVTSPTRSRPFISADRRDRPYPPAMPMLRAPVHRRGMRHVL